VADTDRQLATEIKHRLRDTEFLIDAPIAVEPLVIDPDAYSTMGEAGNTLLQLAMRVLRSLGSSASEMAAALNVDVAQHPSMRACASPAHQDWAATHARPDMILPESGVPQLLELNPSGAAGGFTDIELLAQFWRDHGWRQVPPAECGVFASRRRLLEAARQSAGISKQLIWLGTKLDLEDPQTDRFYQLELAELERDGWQVCHYDPADPEPRISEQLMSAPKLLFRNYTDTEWAGFGFDVETIIAQLFQPGDMMLPDPISDLLDNKLLLALLSSGQSWMSQHNRRIVEQHLPWTRALGSDHPLRIRWPEAFIEPPEVIRQQQSLVLKPAMSMKGCGVLIGRDTAPEVWADAVTRQAQTKTGGIAQQLVEPALFALRVWSEAGSTELTVSPVLSPLLAGGEMCGGLARFDYTGSDTVTVISTTRHATEGLLVPSER
jgi:hypothetical protein